MVDVVALCLLTTRGFLLPPIGLCWTAAAAGKRVGRGRDWRRAAGPRSARHGADAAVVVAAAAQTGQHQVPFFALFLLARHFVEDAQPSAAARSVVVFFSQRLSLVLHPPVLKPDFDLTFRQVQRGGDLDPPRTAQVFVEVELFFQLEQLRVGVGRPQSPRESFIH